MRRIHPLFFLLLFVCSSSLLWAKPLHVLVTGDMHGWLLSQQVGTQQLGGSAEMLAYWKRVEHYQPDKFLVLSCGDVATGPALSVAFQGDPVLEVMNSMGYDASTLGNHEFDFTTAHLKQWEKMASFPFLTANLVKASDGAPADIAQPYAIIQEQGVNIGIIGLTPIDLATLTNQSKAYRTQAYASTLQKYVPEVRAKGVEVVIVLAHVPAPDLIELAGKVTNLNIPLMLGGHSHELDQMKVGNTWVVNSGEWWQSYSRIDIDVEPTSGKSTVLSSRQVWLLQTKPAMNTGIKKIIDRWQRKLDQEYKTPIAYTVTGISADADLNDFVASCWLAADPTSDAAVNNDGSLRQNIPAGQITKETIVGLLPFSNSLYRITLTGEQLVAYLPQGGMAGVRRAGNIWLLTKNNTPIESKTTYQLLLNNYMYETSTALQAADPNPKLIAESWRDPLIDWLIKHPTDAKKPLETLMKRQ